MFFIRQLLTFGYKQALCCIFPVVIFITLAVTKHFPPPYIHRYDLILLVCITAQFLMVKYRMETIDELKVISLFHLIGLFLELYKVHMGSWAYPGEAFSKIGGVPLYSGFMYASVASYVCQAWRRFDLSLHHWPDNKITFPLAFIIYINFFFHHYFIDLRWYIIAALFVIFRKSFVTFKVNDRIYKMNVITSYFLIAIFIWLAENISTFFGAWQYPNQKKHWDFVHIGKLSSWFLLVIITTIIVANLKHIKYGRGKQNAINNS